MTHTVNWNAVAVQGIRQPPAAGDALSIHQLLLRTGIHSFEQQAGYIPSVDDNPLPAAIVASSAMQVHTLHLNDIHRILSTHPQLAMEWVMLLCSVRQTMPDEMIPYYLYMGSQNQRLRPWIKHILTDKAQWLVEQAANPEWDWYPQVEQIHISTLLRTQIEAYSEIIYRVNRSLEHDAMSHAGNTALVKLLHFGLMWTEQITTRFLEALIVSHVVRTFQEGSLLVRVIIRAAYLMPLRYATDLVAELETGADSWQPTLRHVTEIFDLRRSMYTLINGTT